MTIGQKVVRVPETFFDGDLKEGKSNKHPISGTVVYIHPQGRYHVVEFETRGGLVREVFMGAED